jgi:hypothetical protein
LLLACGASVEACVDASLAYILLFSDCLVLRDEVAFGVECEPLCRFARALSAGTSRSCTSSMCMFLDDVVLTDALVLRELCEAMPENDDNELLEF